MSGVKVAEIARRLSSKDEAERVAAQLELKQQGPHAVQVARLLMASPITEARKVDHFLRVSLLVGWLLPPVLFWPLGLAKAIIGWLFYGGIAWCVLLGIIQAIWLARWRSSPKYPISEGVARVLSEMEDIHAVGLLLEIADHLEHQVRQETMNVVRQSLIRLLPQVQIARDVVLSGQQRDSLYHLLKKYSAFVLHSGDTEKGESRGVPRTDHDEALTLAILKAYEQMGDRRALAYIQKLAKADCRTYSVEARMVNQAAQACLPLLQEHTKERSVNETLLRAADKSDSVTQELLRPAHGTSEAKATELLRANSSLSNVETQALHPTESSNVDTPQVNQLNQ